MKKLMGFLVLVLFCSVSLRAESVWTGNAAVGSSLQFPGSREYFRAASNSFPLGTILEVTNPRGQASVTVTVVDRLESPGVFLLMEMNAARLIGIPSDHIRPVQVTPIGSTGVEMYAPVAPSGLSNKEDYSTDESLTNSPIHTYPEDTEITAAPPPEENPVVSTAIVSEPTMIDDLGEFNDAGETLNPVDAYNIGKTESAASIVDQEDPGVAAIPDGIENLVFAEEPNADTENLVESESSIVFLSPSELRPPAGAAIESMEQIFTGVQESEFDIPRFKSGDRGKFIQIGAYRNRKTFETGVEEVQRSNPDYPLRVATISTFENPGQTVYKLLVGPIKPAEIGVVLDAVRRNRFPDAFPFLDE